MITSLVVNQINFKKNYTLYAKRIGNGEIEVSFRLSIPAWVDDKDLIKEKHHSILYARSKKTTPYLVTLDNVSKGYPIVGNSKYFCISRKYDITPWLANGERYMELLTRDREQIFRETRSNIILQEIGENTKKWTDVSEGKYYEDRRVAYGKSKYDRDVEREINNYKQKCEAEVAAF